MTPEQLRASRYAVDLCEIMSGDWATAQLRLAKVPAVGAPEFLLDQATDSEGLAITIGETLYITIPGTDSARDWVSNADATPHDGAHHGFLYAARSLFDQVEPFVRDFEGEIVLGGHSRGGGMVQIIGSDLIDADLVDPRLLRVITFGSPRAVIGKDWRHQALQQATGLRWVNHRDAVPWVPPGRWGYRHTGDLCYLTKSGLLTGSPATYYWQRLGGAITLLRTGRTEGGSDHAIGEYQRLINALTPW